MMRRICNNCKKTNSLYGYENEPEIVYCNKCKKSDMKDIRSKKCNKCNKVFPSYGFENDTIPTRCFGCKELEMINIKKSKCLECKKNALYNIKGETKALYCIDHKLEEMVNVLTPRCLVCCEKVPTYGLNGKKTHCKDCKTDEMSDTHKMCEKCNKIRANFGDPEEYIKRFCKGCAPEGFKDLSNYKCEICMDKRASFGLENDKKPRFCKTCMPNGASDIVHPLCKTELCGTRVLNKYDGYCVRCYMYLFPSKPVAVNYKTKERAVLEFVKENFPDIDIVSDKIIKEGCSRRRPDILIDLGYQIIIVEIDENQHIKYDCTCENKRLMQLSQDVNHIPLIFIRFNPDGYNIKEKKIGSCWSITKAGTTIINKNKKKEWNERLNSLKNTIEYWLDEENTTSKTIEVIQLYYDE
jgi:hypothetical protein